MHKCHLAWLGLRLYLQAVLGLKAHRNKWQSVLPGLDVLSETHNKLIASLDSLQLNCALTHCESIMCQILSRRTSDKTPVRLADATAQFAADSGGQVWRELVHSEIDRLATPLF